MIRSFSRWLNVGFVFTWLLTGCSVSLAPAPRLPIDAQMTPIRPKSLAQGVTPQGTAEGIFCPVLQPPHVTDLRVYPTPPLAEPQARISFHDPVFGSCLARLTDATTDLIAGDTSTGMRTESAAVQPFNFDGHQALARSSQGYWYIYSAETLLPTMYLPFTGDLEVRWDPQVSDRLYFLQSTRLYLFSLRTQSAQLVHDFAADFPQMAVAQVGTFHQGMPSAEGRYWPLIALDAHSQALALVIYDLSTDQVSARRSLPAETTLSGVTISQQGNTFLAWFAKACPASLSGAGGVGNAAEPACGVVAYDRHLENPRVLLPSSGAADVAIDASGHEVLVYNDLKLNSISMIDLQSAQSTDLWLVDMHAPPLGISISGRSQRLPGWAVISVYGGSDSSWMNNSLFAVELRAQGKVVRLAHLHTQSAPNSFSGALAAANPDLTRVLFTSNWGRSGAGESDLYLLALPTGWVDMLK